MSCEIAIEVVKNLQLKQLRNISLAFVDINDMPFYDEFRGRSCCRGQDEREDGEGGFQHCGGIGDRYYYDVKAMKGISMMQK